MTGNQCEACGHVFSGKHTPCACARLEPSQRCVTFWECECGWSVTAGLPEFKPTACPDCGCTGGLRSVIYKQPKPKITPQYADTFKCLAEKAARMSEAYDVDIKIIVEPKRK